MDAVLDWAASVFDSRVTPTDAILWILLATLALFVFGVLSRAFSRWDDGRQLGRHERARQTTTWVLVAVAVGVVAISSALAMLTVFA